MTRGGKENLVHSLSPLVFLFDYLESRLLGKPTSQCIKVIHALPVLPAAVHEVLPVKLPLSTIH